MKSWRILSALCVAVLLLCGCEAGGDSSQISAVQSVPPLSLAQASSQNTEEQTESSLSGDRFVNQTIDMTFIIDGESCEPGQSLILREPLTSFTYKTQEYEREQEFRDFAFRHEPGMEIVAANDAEKGHILIVFRENKQDPDLQYLLIPQNLYWTHCELDQKLFLGNLPDLPMEQILEIYPDAVLPLGFREVGWPDGYTYMLWSYEPLNDLRISSTGVMDIEDEEWLYGYVDWDALEGTTLLPGAPLFTDVVTVGSSWTLAVRFEDAAGTEPIYLGGENGLGSDRPGLILYPLKGRILSEEETLERQGQQSQ